MNKNQKIWLAVILIGGFLLHLLAINHALPVRFFGDEYIHLASSLKMLDQKTLFLDFSYLPPLFAYLLMPFILLYGLIGMIFGVFNDLAGFREYVLLNSENLLVLSRFIGAMFGTLSVYFVFKLAKEVFNIQVAFLSAIIFILIPINIIEAQSGRFWLPMSFFMLLGAYCMVKLFKTGKTKWYLLSTLSICLGFGMGYLAVILLAWFILFHLLHVKKNSLKFFNRNLLFSALIFIFSIVFFSFANSYAFIRQFARGLGTFLDPLGISLSVPQIEAVHQINNYFPVLAEVLESLWSNFYLLVILIFGAFILLIKKKELWKNGTNYLLVVFPVAYILALPMIFSDLLDRYATPVYIYLTILSAYGLYQLSNQFKISQKKVIIVLLLLIFLSPQLLFIFQYVPKLYKTNTYILAKNWLEDNISNESRIIVNCHHFYLNSNKQALLFQQENNSSKLDTKSKFLLNLPKEDYPKPNYLTYDLADLDSNKINIEDFSVDYFVACSYNKEFGPETLTEEKKQLIEKYELESIAEFFPNKAKYGNFGITSVQNDFNQSLNTLNKIERFGPRIKIYKLILKNE